jgi:hypothetical protein
MALLRNFSFRTTFAKKRGFARLLPEEPQDLKPSFAWQISGQVIEQV